MSKLLPKFVTSKCINHVLFFYYYSKVTFYGNFVLGNVIYSAIFLYITWEPTNIANLTPLI